MSDNTHCNFRREKCSKERSQTLLKCTDLKIETHRMLNVIKVIPVKMGQQEPYQNNSENI
jgi:hypothetical protein